MAYQPLALESNEYFEKYTEMLNAEIEKEMRKMLKGVAQKQVSEWGQMPYGSKVAGEMTSDIYGQGLEQMQKGGVNIALGAALPQYQAGVNWQTLLQQQKYGAEQSEFERALRKELAKMGFEWETMQAEAGKTPWWQELLGGLATGAGYALAA